MGKREKMYAKTNSKPHTNETTTTTTATRTLSWLFLSFFFVHRFTFAYITSVWLWRWCQLGTHTDQSARTAGCWCSPYVKCCSTFGIRHGAATRLSRVSKASHRQRPMRLNALCNIVRRAPAKCNAADRTRTPYMYTTAIDVSFSAPLLLLLLLCQMCRAMGCRRYVSRANVCYSNVSTMFV